MATVTIQPGNAKLVEILIRQADGDVLCSCQAGYDTDTEARRGYQWLVQAMTSGWASRSSESARRIEDLRVSLIRAINTALAHAGVELPTAAAATVAPTPTVWTPEFAAAFGVSPDLAAAQRRAEQAEQQRDDAWTDVNRLVVEREDARAARAAAERERDEAIMRAEQAESRLKTECAVFISEPELFDKMKRELNEARAAVKALEDWREDWRVDVTCALLRPSTHYADVPRHVRDLVRAHEAERERAIRAERERNDANIRASAAEIALGAGALDEARRQRDEARASLTALKDWRDTVTATLAQAHGVGLAFDDAPKRLRAVIAERDEARAQLQDAQEAEQSMRERARKYESERDEARALLRDAQATASEATGRAEGLEAERDHYRRASTHYAKAWETACAALRERVVVTRDGWRRCGLCCVAWRKDSFAAHAPECPLAIHPTAPIPTASEAQ
jgi:hypothetical protein